MSDILLSAQALLKVIGDLNKKYEFSQNIPENYYEPGNMEYLDCYFGHYDTTEKKAIIRFDAKGLRYDNRTETLESLSVGDPVVIKRDAENEYNSNNFMLLTSNGKSLGNMPAYLCDALAPLYDLGYAVIDGSKISFLERIEERSRYAKQGVLFVEMQLSFRGI